jgi:polyketide biosynthesis acyl carrier protein
MTPEQILIIVEANIREINPALDGVEIDRSSMLSPLGLDSIGRAELLEKTLEDINLKISRYELHAAQNLGELSDMLSQKLIQRA